MFLSYNEDPLGMENEARKFRRCFEKIWQAEEEEKHTMNEKKTGRVSYVPYNSKLTPRYGVPPIPESIIFNGPATIIKWADGSKTVVKTQNNEPFDPEKGIAMAFLKKIFGNKSNYNTKLKKYIKSAITQESKGEK